MHSPSVSSQNGGTPLTRKRTWQQKNGRWFRIAEDGSVISRGVDGKEMIENEAWSPSSIYDTDSPRPEKDFVSPMTGHSGPGFGKRASMKGKDKRLLSGTPPSLPLPPSELPKSLQISSPVTLTPGKLQAFNLSSSSLNGMASPSGIRGEDIFASPPSVYSFATTAFSPPVGSPLHTASLNSSTKNPSPSRFKRASDLNQGASFSAFGAAALSVKTANELKRGSVSSGTSSEDGGYEGIEPLNGDSISSAGGPSSPKRRAAIATRPPRKYQASLSSGLSSSGRSPSQTAGSPTSIGKSYGMSSPNSNARSSTSASRGIKSPAGKERERKEAMNRVNSMLNKSWKQKDLDREIEKLDNE